MKIFVRYISEPIELGNFLQYPVRFYDQVHAMEIVSCDIELTNPQIKFWGADDAWQDVDWAYRLHQAIPESQSEAIEDSGHSSPADQLETLA